MSGDAIGGVLFDLDGVLVTTDELHFTAWKALADAEGIPFDRATNERLRGVSRMESLEILLERAARPYSAAEKESLAGRKNERYRSLLAGLDESALLPGAVGTLRDLRERGVPAAVASSSRNARAIVSRLCLKGLLSGIVDGTDIARSKPDPEVFEKAAASLGLPPGRCLVVEDAAAGVESGLRAGCVVLAVGAVAADPGCVARADAAASSLADLTVAEMLAIEPRDAGRRAER